MTTLAEAVGDLRRVIEGPFGSKLTQKDYSERGVPVIRAGNMSQNGRWIGGDFVFVTPEKFDRDLKTNVARSGDIIVTQRGTLGQVSIVPNNTQFENFVVSQSQMAISVDPEIACRDFVYYYLVSAAFKRHIENSTIQAGVPHINLGILRDAPAPWPPKKEQVTIADVLTSLDDKIELNRQMNEVLEGMARAVFRDWFVDFGPTRRKMAGEGDPVKILGGAIGDHPQTQKTAALFPDRLRKNCLPEGWEEVTVKKIASQIQNGGTPSRKRPDYWKIGNVPWLTSGEVRQSFVTKTKAFIPPEGLANSSAKLIPAGSVLIALYGATAGQVSFATVPISTNQAVCAVIPYDNSRYYLLLAMRDKVNELARSAVGSAQQNISKKIVEDVGILRAPTTIHSEFHAQRAEGI